MPALDAAPAAPAVEPVAERTVVRALGAAATGLIRWAMGPALDEAVEEVGSARPVGEQLAWIR